MMGNSACFVIVATSRHLGLNSNRLLASNHAAQAIIKSETLTTLTMQQARVVQIRAFLHTKLKGMRRSL